MKRHETRVLVEQSDDRVEYYAQYKWYFLWCIPVWETFDPAFTTKNIQDAWYMVIRENGINDTSKEGAERMCELYHQLCDEQQEKLRKEKLHRKTRKITSYKHP